jgi:hypothetical protein
MRGKNTMVRKSFSRKESAGLTSGLTECSEFMADDTLTDATMSDASSNAQGYSRQAKGKLSSKSAKEKGNSFEIDGCK